MSLSSSNLSYISRGVIVGGLSSSILNAALSSVNPALRPKASLDKGSFSMTPDRLLKLGALASVLTIALQSSGDGSSFQNTPTDIPIKHGRTPARPIIISLSSDGSNPNPTIGGEIDPHSESGIDGMRRSPSPPDEDEDSDPSDWDNSGGSDDDSDRDPDEYALPPVRDSSEEPVPSLPSSDSPRGVFDGAPPPPPPPPPPSSTAPGIDNGIPSPFYLGICCLSGYLLGAILFYILRKRRGRHRLSSRRSPHLGLSSKRRGHDQTANKSACKGNDVLHPFPAYETCEVYLSNDAVQVVDKYSTTSTASVSDPSSSTSVISSELALYGGKIYDPNSSLATITTTAGGDQFWRDLLDFIRTNRFMNIVYWAGAVGACIFLGYHDSKNRWKEYLQKKPEDEEFFDYAAMSKLLYPALAISSDKIDDNVNNNYVNNNVNPPPPDNTDAPDPEPEQEHRPKLDDTVLATNLYTEEVSPAPVIVPSFLLPSVQPILTYADIFSIDSPESSGFQTLPSISDFKGFDFDSSLEEDEEGASGLEASIHAPAKAKIEETALLPEAFPVPLITFEPALNEDEQDGYKTDTDLQALSAIRTHPNTPPHFGRTASCSDVDDLRIHEEQNLSSVNSMLSIGDCELYLDASNAGAGNSTFAQRSYDSALDLGAESFDRGISENAPAQSTFIHWHAKDDKSKNKEQIQSPPIETPALTGCVVLGHTITSDRTRHLSASIHAPHRGVKEQAPMTPSTSSTLNAPSFLVSPNGRSDISPTDIRTSSDNADNSDNDVAANVTGQSMVVEDMSESNGQRRKRDKKKRQRTRRKTDKDGKGKEKEDGQVDDGSFSSEPSRCDAGPAPSLSSASAPAPLDVAAVTDILIPASEDRDLYRSIHAPAPEVAPATILTPERSASAGSSSSTLRQTQEVEEGAEEGEGQDSASSISVPFGSPHLEVPKGRRRRQRGRTRHRQ